MLKETNLRYAAEDLLSRALGKKRTYEIPGGGIRIVAVHGFGGGWETQKLERLCKLNGRRALFPELGFQTKGVDYYAGQLQELIPDEPFVGIGYSMGGLILIRLAEKLGWGNIHKIVTLATPLNGINTKVPKRLQRVPAIADMLPDSHVVQTLDLDSIPLGKLTAVFGKEDNIATPRVQLPSNIHTITLAGNHSTVATKAANIEAIYNEHLVQ